MCGLRNAEVAQRSYLQVRGQYEKWDRWSWPEGVAEIERRGGPHGGSQRVSCEQRRIGSGHMSDPDAAALAAFGGGNEDYDTFLKTVPGARESVPELDLKLLPYAGSLVAAPQHSAAAVAAARDAAAHAAHNDTEAEQQIRTDADVY